MLKEFKTFAMRGNVVDLAIGVIIGGAFGKIVDSLVRDIIMPPIGKILGGIDFSNLFWNLSGGEYETLEMAQEAGAVTLNYGLFINTIISFLIIAWAMFIVIKAMNKLDNKQPPAPNTKNCNFCFSVINKEATRCPNCTSTI